jgi:glycosyltransferase involved in cell wall biosynthesis
MKVVFYTRPCFLDVALARAKPLSKMVDLNLLIEVDHGQWNCSIFEVAPQKLPSGIVDADSVLRDLFPPGIRDYWKDLKSFNLIIHNCKRNIHPVTWWTSHVAQKFIQNLKADVIHLDEMSIRFAPEAARIKKVPLVMSIHDPEPHSGEYSWRSDLARWLTFRRIDRFILHNHYQISNFCKRYNVPVERVNAIPLGVYHPFREWLNIQIHEDDPTVLFFGRLSEYKGIEILYQAAPLVAQKVQGVRFIVAGKPVPGYQLPLQPTIDNGGQFVVIEEYISNNDLAALFQKATVIVCPYLDATQSGVILTAYAFNKPVIATETGGLPEYVSHNKTGLLIPPKDPESLASALVNILTDNQLRKQLKAGIKPFAKERLSWKKIATDTVDVYEKMQY